MTVISLLPRMVLVGSIAVIAATPFSTAGFAQSASDVMKATLNQPKEKTAEVSTDELRQILADGSAMVFDARPHLEFEWNLCCLGRCQLELNGLGLCDPRQSRDAQPRHLHNLGVLPLGPHGPIPAGCRQHHPCRDYGGRGPLQQR